MAQTGNKAAKHKAVIHWEKQPDGGEVYSWSFDNGVVIHNATHAPLAQQGMIDPESAFVASVASCHMLSLLAMAVKRGFTVAQYHDEAIGVLGLNREHRIAVTRILLRPRIRFQGEHQPSDKELTELHDATRQNCFIANSITTQVHVDPVTEQQNG
ncbi:MAG: OsmC family protein [Ketobacteraceae bacterium]|nr:OsmC family protein [Ketobacteraceae bacterium]